MNTILFGGFSLEDNFPGLANVLGLLTRWFVSNKADEAHKRWDDLLETIVSDHEIRRRSEHGHGGGGGVDQEESDFIDVLLSVQQEYGITRDHIKAILMVRKLYIYFPIISICLVYIKIEYIDRTN